MRSTQSSGNGYRDEVELCHRSNLSNSCEFLNYV